MKCGPRIGVHRMFLVGVAALTVACLAVAVGLTRAQAPAGQPEQEQPPAADAQPDAEQNQAQPDAAQPDEAQPDVAQPDEAQPDDAARGRRGRGGRGGQRGGGGGRRGAPAGPPTLEDITAPEGFEVTLFGVPDDGVNYPVCLSAAPTGELFIGVDDQGSLGRTPERGKVLRCVDTDGDGKADVVNVFANVDHPRGLVYDNGSLWVLHPPFLSVYHDDDRDGVSDRSEVLISNITTDQLNQRGADHTTNGIRMGIDGWIYVAVGDFGFVDATAADGKVMTLRGGGVLRVRPDGSEMEMYALGLRNIVDMAIDPYLNVYTRDNTNDGGGWDIRVSHIMQSAHYGYPSLFINFTDEIMPPLAQLGGGSGCGALFLHDVRWPAPYGDALYTCDWGTNQIFRHNFAASGPTFEMHQEEFIRIPRPTDLETDGLGRMYVASWKGGQYNYAGENIGFVARIVPSDFEAAPFPNLAEATIEQLVNHLAAPSAVYRLHSQREILRRGQSPEATQAIVALASSADTPLYGRVAAIFTLKQLDGAEAREALVQIAQDAAVREFAIRALTDRLSQLEGVSPATFVAALQDESPRVRAQAAISLGRLGDASVAANILPLTSRPEGSTMPTEEPVHGKADPDRVIPHLAVQALVRLNAVEASVAALEGPNASGALWAMRSMHGQPAVDGLVARLGVERNEEMRKKLLSTLIRLYYQEGEYTGSWWNTRPDTSGPYYDRTTWEQSPRIVAVIENAIADGSEEMAAFLQAEAARHVAQAGGGRGGRGGRRGGRGGRGAEPEPQADAPPPVVDPLVAIARRTAPAEVVEVEPQTPIELPTADPNNPNMIANLAADVATRRALEAEGDAERGKALFEAQSCRSCHTDADGQSPKGPHLVDIGKRYNPQELVESVILPSAKIAQGFDTYSFITNNGQVLTGFVVLENADSVRIREQNGMERELDRTEIETREKQEPSMMPEGIVGNLTPEQLADLLAYLRSLD